MKNYLFIIIFLILGCDNSTESQDTYEQLYGCTDPSACNFDPNANTYVPNSCEYNFLCNPNNIDNYFGYTVSDSLGNILSSDENDWCSNSIPDITFILDEDSMADSTADSTASVNDFFNVVIPSQSTLYPAFPNPAITNTFILFDLAQTSSINMIIIDENNNLVKYLYENFALDAGVHYTNWDLTDNDDQRVEPGLYRCIIEFNSEICMGDILVN